MAKHLSDSKGQADAGPSVQLVQMIPLRRCGSHAIRLRLAQNPKFYSPYPLHVIDFMPLLDLYGSLRNDEAYFQLVVDLVGFQAMSLVKWPGLALNPIAVFERIKDRPRSIHTVAWEFLKMGAEVTGATTIMDKSLDNVLHWPELVRLYPQMKFINLVRDPRAQVSSINRAIIHNFDTLLNAKLLAQNYQAAGALIKKHPEKVLTVRFEDFIVNTEPEFKRICEFLDLEYRTEMLDVSRSTEAQEIAKQSPLWSSNNSAPIIANIDKFKQSLSSHEIKLIESVCKDAMKQYGYAPLLGSSVRVTAAMEKTAKKNSEAKKKKAWHELSQNFPQDFVLRSRRLAYLEMCRQNLIDLKFNKTKRRSRK